MVSASKFFFVTVAVCSSALALPDPDLDQHAFIADFKTQQNVQNRLGVRSFGLDDEHFVRRAFDEDEPSLIRRVRVKAGELHGQAAQANRQLERQRQEAQAKLRNLESKQAQMMQQASQTFRGAEQSAKDRMRMSLRSLGLDEDREAFVRRWQGAASVANAELERQKAQAQAQLRQAEEKQKSLMSNSRNSYAKADGAARSAFGRRRATIKVNYAEMQKGGFNPNAFQGTAKTAASQLQQQKDEAARRLQDANAKMAQMNQEATQKYAQREKDVSSNVAKVVQRLGRREWALDDFEERDWEDLEERDFDDDM